MNEWAELERNYLAEAEQHIAVSKARMARLRAEIGQLEREGRDACASRQALETLERSLQLMRHYQGVVVRLLREQDQKVAAPTA